MERTATAATSAPCQASQFSRLPAALLTRILQGLPQQDRLSSCAAVRTSWAAAATAATVEVDMSDAPANAIAAFQPWLDRHAGQLVSLNLKLHDCLEATHFCDLVFKPSVFKLPCSDLQQLSRLDLAGVKLQLGSATDAGSSSSSTAMLPKLKALKIQDCLNLRTLPRLAQLSGITRFKLVATSQVVRGAQLKQGALQQLLQGLPKLAHLSLVCTAAPAGIIRVLPSNSLTALTFGPSCDSTHPELPDSISRLASPRKLKLEDVKLQPAVLSRLTLLTHLQLEKCEVAAGSAAAFLAAVRDLRQLQHLSLVSNADPMNLGTAQPHDCAALTAASQLSHLEVFSFEAQPLPATAVQHMFPAGKQFPQLQQLLIACFSDDSAGRVTTAELRGIISACPALASLDVNCVLAEDVDVSALLQLPATCCSLKVGGEPFGDSAAGVVAQLTQLTCLQWNRAFDLTDAELQPLTALSALQLLKMLLNNNLSDAVVDKDEGLMKEPLELVPAAEKSVSQQLRELLRSTPTSAAWLARVEQQQQEICGQRERLCALSCCMLHTVDVLMFCASDTEVMAAVRSMAAIGRSLLGGGGVEGGDGSGSVQRYLQLQGRVLEFCARSDDVAAALSSMEAAVRRAVDG